jgi:hypothetical protein
VGHPPVSRTGKSRSRVCAYPQLRAEGTLAAVVQHSMLRHSVESLVQETRCRYYALESLADLVTKREVPTGEGRRTIGADKN